MKVFDILKMLHPTLPGLNLPEPETNVVTTNTPAQDQRLRESSDEPNSLGALFELTYRELRPRAPIPGAEIKFYRFAGINNTIRLREGKIFIRLSDVLEGAPEPVLHAILHILVAKLYRKPIQRHHATLYRRHVSSHDVVSKAHMVRQARGRKTITTTKGHRYDLETIFEDLNRRFFFGLMARPRLTWSVRDSKQILGHYDPAHHTIVISKIFDKPHVPLYALEYLVFHEMLHLKHPVKLRGSRRCVHSQAFQADEKLFPQFQEAKAFLRTL